jgi:hypothetical protein
MGTLIDTGDRKCAASPGRRFFKEQRDVQSFEYSVANTSPFLDLEFGRQGQQLTNLLRREIQQFEE